MLITRRVDLSVVLYSLLFFPGVVLHETSHYIMARLLRVPTGRISLIPQTTSDGKLQMGSVETNQTDWFRDAAIGMAPLITGGMAVAYIGLMKLGLLELWHVAQELGTSTAWEAASAFYTSADFWLWFYLAFAIGSTMFPSSSDRRAWLPVVGTLLLLLTVALILGAGPWMMKNLAPYFNRTLLAVDVVFAISLGIHLFLFIPALATRLLLARLTGYKIVAG